MRGDRIGTHNLDVHTGKAEATPFADWLLFTEAVRGEVRKDLPADYVVDECTRNRSLVVAWHGEAFTKHRGIYVPAHPGLRKVTPRRGTYAVLGEDRGGRKTALVVEHRINAARPPYRRGEASLRKMLHAIHSANTKRLVRHLVKASYVVFVGGDPNLPKWERAYPYLPVEVGRNVGHGLDRIGSTKPLGGVHGERGTEDGHLLLSAVVMR